MSSCASVKVRLRYFSPNVAYGKKKVIIFVPRFTTRGQHTFYVKRMLRTWLISRRGPSWSVCLCWAPPTEGGPAGLRFSSFDFLNWSGDTLKFCHPMLPLRLNTAVQKDVWRMKDWSLNVPNCWGHVKASSPAAATTLSRIEVSCMMAISPTFVFVSSDVWCTYRTFVCRCYFTILPW